MAFSSCVISYIFTIDLCIIIISWVMFHIFSTLECHHYCTKLFHYISLLLSFTIVLSSVAFSQFFLSFIKFLNVYFCSTLLLSFFSYAFYVLFYAFYTLFFSLWLTADFKCLFSILYLTCRLLIIMHVVALTPVIHFSYL